MRNTVPEGPPSIGQREPSMRLLRSPSSPLAERSRRGAGGPDGMVPFSFSRVVVAQARREMTAFTIHASKNGQTITTVRIGPMVCVEKAKTLLGEGWQVHITSAVGHRYGPDEFNQLAAELHSAIANS